MTEEVKVANYLWQSIVVTVLCCLPFGIVAIVFAAKVNGLVQAGKIEEAQAASNTAKMWCWISFGVGLVVIILQILLNIGVIAGAAASDGGF